MAEKDATEEPRHCHPEDHDTEDEDEFDDWEETKYYFPLMFGASWICVACLCIVTFVGGWAGNSIPVYVSTFFGNITANDQYSLWGHCHCYQNTRDEKCSTVSKFFLGGQITSLISLSMEAGVIFLLAAVYSGFWRKFRHHLNVTACVLSYIATASELTCFASFSIAYARTWCGEIVRKRGYVSWSFPMRIAEFCFSVVFCFALTLQTVKRGRRLAKTLLFAMCAISVFTVCSTIGRGWIRNSDTDMEYGLWQSCHCTQIPCGSELTLLQLAQACASCGIFATMAFILAFFLHLSKRLQMPLIVFATMCTLAVTCLFAVWYITGFCGAQNSPKAMGVVLRWPFFVAASAVLLNVGVIANLWYRWAWDVV